MVCCYLDMFGLKLISCYHGNNKKLSNKELNWTEKNCCMAALLKKKELDHFISAIYCVYAKNSNISNYKEHGLVYVPKVTF